MAKAMSIAGMIVAGLLALTFGLDLIPGLGIPFNGAEKLTDAGFLVSAAILGYLSWNAFRDSR
ncbi:MAG TPA: hypothetical protein VGM76_07465 [Lacipirellulaceae bacterium]|jgi:hypothetical protein